jgi:hypothetical protein
VSTIYITINLILFNMKVLAYSDRMERCGNNGNETAGFTNIRVLYRIFFLLKALWDVIY